MGLREIAEADLAHTLEDMVCGGGWPILITSPRGQVESFVGLSGDISQTIDPDTGQAVSGRTCHATLRSSSLLAKFGELPQGLDDVGALPWVVDFTDVGGESHKFKVVEQIPDRTLGMVTFALVFYSEG